MTSPVLEAIRAKIERDERTSLIDYNLNRVSSWRRRPGLSYGRRAPGLLARLACWVVYLVKGTRASESKNKGLAGPCDAEQPRGTHERLIEGDIT